MDVYQKVCRLCLARAPQNSQHSLLDSPMAQMYEALTFVKIEEDDSLPNVMCTRCFLKMKLAYNIQQSILKSEKYLKERMLLMDENMPVLHKEVFLTEEGTIKSEFKEEDYEENDEETIINDAEEIEPPTAETKYISCIICGEQTEQNLDHFLEHFKTPQYCSTCKNIFKDFHSYKEHLSSCSNEPYYQCTHCIAKFQYKSFYDLHLRTVHKPPLPEGPSLKKKIKISPAILCQNKGSGADIPESSREAILKLGIRSKQAIEVLLEENLDGANAKASCHECGKVFDSKRKLSYHTHKKKPCPICGKEVGAFNFGTHIRDHEGSQVCEICGTVAKDLTALRSHRANSHGKLSHECKECGMKFRKKSKLVSHMRRHTGERPSVCDSCGKSFFSAYFLKCHYRMTHLKLRPNVCKYCKKGFSSSYALKTHERQHTNETPYKCDICSEGFRQKVSLKSHQKSKHGIEEAKTVHCKICQKGFGSEHALKTHNRLHL